MKFPVYTYIYTGNCLIYKKHPNFYNKIGDAPQQKNPRTKDNLVHTISKLELHSSGPYMTLSYEIHKYIEKKY